MEQFVVTPSNPLVKALAIGAQSQALQTQYPLPTEPALLDAISGLPTTGVFELCPAGITTPERVMVIPYAHSPAGVTFLVRLIGWRRTGGNDNAVVWVGPITLGEFACTTAELPGPYEQAVPPLRTLSATQRLCDTIVLNNPGVPLGVHGEILNPQNGTVALAIVDVRGCQKAQFDFAIEDGTANCFWCAV